MLQSHSISHRGVVREVNEDSLVEDLGLGIWVIADGVGGNGHGDMASQLATQTVERRLRQGAAMGCAIRSANEAIEQAVVADNTLSGMATTLLACQFTAGHFELAWVGDSRAYLLNGSGIVQLSNDHNVAGDLLQSGKITAAEALAHPGRHELTQALGQLSLEKIPKSIGELHDGDYLLLCTDGLSGVLDSSAIYDLVMQAGTLAEATENLLDQVLAKGAPDNVTVSLIRFVEDQAAIQASDFEQPSYRLPFDRRPYNQHCRNRPWLLLVVLLAIVMLVFVI